MESEASKKIIPTVKWVADKVAEYYLVAILFGGASLSILISSIRDFLWNSASAILTTSPIEWQLKSIAIVLIAFLLVLGTSLYSFNAYQ